MKPREIQCVDCGKMRLTCSRGIRCNPCATVVKYAERRNRIKKALEDLGHINVEFVGITDTGKTKISFTHHSCGTKQTWQASNITKVLKNDPITPPCSLCGSKRRVVAATKRSAEVRAIPEDQLTAWEIYRRRVRCLTEQTYRKFKDEINPLGLKRSLGTSGHHLDHKFPIVRGFLHGIDAEIISAKENLQMLSGFDNMSKGSK